MFSLWFLLGVSWFQASPLTHFELIFVLKCNEHTALCTVYNLMIWLTDFCECVRESPISFFGTWSSSFPNTIYWRDYSLPADYSWLRSQALVDCTCMGLFSGLQFCSISLMSVFTPAPNCFGYYTFIIYRHTFFHCALQVLLFFTNWRFMATCTEQVYWGHFSNSHLLTSWLSHFGNSLSISNFFIIVFLLVICDQWLRLTESWVDG